jgi:hypothetical protein
MLGSAREKFCPSARSQPKGSRAPAARKAYENFSVDLSA